MDKMAKLREKAKREGFNPSEDALFIVSEIRDTRNLLLAVLLSLLSADIGIGIAILVLI